MDIHIWHGKPLAINETEHRAPSAGNPHFSLARMARRRTISHGRAIGVVVFQQQVSLSHNRASHGDRDQTMGLGGVIRSIPVRYVPLEPVQRARSLLLLSCSVRAADDLDALSAIQACTTQLSSHDTRRIAPSKFRSRCA